VVNNFAASAARSYYVILRINFFVRSVYNSSIDKYRRTIKINAFIREAKVVLVLEFRAAFAGN